MELSEMDAVVHEYRLAFRPELGNHADVNVCAGRLLSVALRQGEIFLWAAVDPHKGPTPMRFHLVGTGASLHTSWWHLGSVMEGPRAWHIFSESRTIRASGGLAEPGPGPRPGPTR